MSQKNKLLLSIPLFAVSTLLFVAFANKTSAVDAVANQCQPTETSYPIIKDKWNLMAMPYLSNKATGKYVIGSLFNSDNSLKMWSYEGLGTDSKARYEEASDGLIRGRGFWLKSSTDKLCIKGSDTLLLEKIKSAEFNGSNLNIITNPGKDTLKLTDITIKLGNDTAGLKLSEALTKVLATGETEPAVNMIAFWDPKTAIYTVYVNRVYNKYAENYKDNKNITVKPYTELIDKQLDAFTGIWVATRDSEKVTVEYTTPAATTEAGAAAGGATAAGPDATAGSSPTLLDAQGDPSNPNTPFRVVR